MSPILPNGKEGRNGDEFFVKKGIHCRPGLVLI